MKIILPGEQWLEIWTEDYNALAKFVNFVIPWIIDKRGIKQDNAKFKRWENAQTLFIKAKKLTEYFDWELSEPPLKISTPLLENASLESESELQDKWASLLANSLTWKKDIKPMFIEILKELSWVEVRILDIIYKDALAIWWEITDIKFSSHRISVLFELDINEVRLIVDNIYRLRLAEAPSLWWIDVWGVMPVWKTNDTFQMTYLWIRFIEACQF